MSRFPRTLRSKRKISDKHSYKVGQPVAGVKAVFPSEKGEEEAGTVVYKRKVEYRGVFKQA